MPSYIHYENNRPESCVVWWLSVRTPDHNSCRPALAGVSAISMTQLWISILYIYRQPHSIAMESSSNFVYLWSLADSFTTPNMTLKHCAKKNTSHQVTTMLSTRAIIKVSGHHYQWLAWWLWPGNSRTFLEEASMVVTWWIHTFKI